MVESTTLFGKYEILDELGKGGFATVYRARDTTLDREVALKILHPQLLSDSQFVQRFRQEARMLASLRHPQIITIYEVEEFEGRLFIAMELVPGPSLAQSIARRGHIPWAEALTLLEPICEALDYAHSQEVVHRDLKPSNILLDPRRGPLLTDFGFARLVGKSSLSLSVSGGIVGTPGYIAPEVWDLDATAAPVDIYALGCIVYEMLSGEVLFRGQTPMQVMRAHDHGPQFPAVWRAEVPPGIQATLGRALARAPSARYPSAMALWRALHDLPAQPRPSPPASRGLQPEPPPPADSGPAPAGPAPLTKPLPSADTGGGPAGPAPRPEPPRPAVGPIPARRRRIPALAWVAGVILLALVAWLVYAFLLPQDGNATADPTAAPLVAVPNLVGLEDGAAAETLQGLGLRPDRQAEHSGTPAGRVIRQFPPAGTSLAAAAFVKYVVSLGPVAPPTLAPTAAPLVVVPNLVGLEDGAAAEALRGLGLRPDRQAEHSDTPAGRVIRQFPPAGTSLAAAAFVKYVVSLGPVAPPTLAPTAVPLVAVPNLVGLEDGAAAEALRAVGLVVDRHEAYDQAPAGQVIRQDPPMGTNVLVQSPVSYVVSLGPPPSPDDIRNFRVQQVSEREIVITVDYTYQSDHGDGNIGIGAYALRGGETLVWFGYRPARVSRGNGTASIDLLFDANNPPPNVATDQIKVAMYIGGGSEFYSEVFDYAMTWSSAPVLTAPQQLSPADGTVFDHYPRTTTLQWQAVPGAASYGVEVEFCQPAGCDSGTAQQALKQGLMTTSYTFDFVGAQPGRWRVWAADANGQEGPKSDWWGFSYTR